MKEIQFIPPLDALSWRPSFDDAPGFLGGCFGILRPHFSLLSRTSRAPSFLSLFPFLSFYFLFFCSSGYLDSEDFDWLSSPTSRRIERRHWTMKEDGPCAAIPRNLRETFPWKIQFFETLQESEIIQRLSLP